MQNFIYFATLLILIIVAYIDYKTMIIPDKSHILIAFLGIINIALDFKNIKIYILSTIIVFSFFFIIAIISSYVINGKDGESGIGGGDIKLFTALSLVFGYDMFWVIEYTYIIASVVAIIMLILKKTNLKSSVALAPFIMLGTLAHLLLR